MPGAKQVTSAFPMVSQIAHEGHLVRENHIGLGFGAQKQVSQLSVEDLSKNSDPGAVLITERERERARLQHGALDDRAMSKGIIRARHSN